MVNGELLAHGLVTDADDQRVLDSWIVDMGTVDVAEATECSAVAAVNAIAAARTVVPDLDDIIRVVKMTGYVASPPGFRSHPIVINGASDLFGAIWAERGGHARVAVGVPSLPLDSPVELEVIFEVR